MADQAGASLPSKEMRVLISLLGSYILILVLNAQGQNIVNISEGSVDVIDISL